MKEFHHAEMAYVIRREKEIEERLTTLKKEFGLWKERVDLAKKAGRDELASAALERVDKLREEAAELREELKITEAKKQLIRRESRRPTGIEVQRAEALLDSFREMGIDPDEAARDREFDELRKQGFDED